ncbi:MAG TPA: NPCBM/NEW2 domain-containing protein [Planctomycetota bacterium]|nr:NPCBM/NEW2 domain-containing protein [Planctomycetota bacterium]
MVPAAARLPAAGKGRRACRIAVRIALVLAASAVTFELALRFVLFSSLADSWALARALRSPTFAEPSSEDLYWQLQHIFEDPARRIPVPTPDPVVGWLGYAVRPGDYAHADELRLRGRRPVLLYGDSYAQCNTLPRDCFQGLFERSPLAGKHALLNYGIGGYGLDQIGLLLERSLPRFQELEPRVVIGILVEDDLDRSVLSFRGWPKPRLELEDGDLVLREPVAATVEEHFERHPLPIVSFAWRGLVRGTKLLPRALRERLKADPIPAQAKQALNRRILERMVEQLRGRGIEPAFVLFYTEAGISRPEVLGWRDAFVRGTLDGLGARWVSTRGLLLGWAEATGREVSELYGGSQRLEGHLNVLGNQVAFLALAEALRGGSGELGWSASAQAELEALEPSLPPAANIAKRVLRGPSAAARHESGLRAPFANDDRERLCMRVGEEGPTEVVYELKGRVKSFSASAAMIPIEGAAPDCGRVGLSILADGRVLWSATIAAGGKEQEVSVDLTGRGSMTVRADDGGDGVECDWVVLFAPLFE